MPHKMRYALLVCGVAIRTQRVHASGLFCEHCVNRLALSPAPLRPRFQGLAIPSWAKD